LCWAPVTGCSRTRRGDLEDTSKASQLDETKLSTHLDLLGGHLG
jgi:hypothetical protein